MLIHCANQFSQLGANALSLKFGQHNQTGFPYGHCTRLNVNGMKADQLIQLVPSDQLCMEVGGNLHPHVVVSGKIALPSANGDTSTSVAQQDIIIQYYRCVFLEVLFIMG
jgi:hypothetical protein